MPPGGEINFEKDPGTYPDICPPASSILYSAGAGPQNSVMKCEHENHIVLQGVTQSPGGAHGLGCCHDMKLDGSMYAMSPTPPAEGSCRPRPSTHPGCKMKHCTTTDDKANIPCRMCEDRCSRQASLRNHKSHSPSHTGKNQRLMCQNCNKYFPMRQNLEDNFLQHEQSIDHLGHMCPPPRSPGN